MPISRPGNDAGSTDLRVRLVAILARALAGAPEVLELPADRARPAVQLFHGAFLPLVWRAELTAQVHRFARQGGLTPFMVLLAAFDMLLSRITGHDDIVVGVPMAHRTHTELEPLIGCFVNTLPVRTRLHDDPTGHTLLARVKETCLAAYATRICRSNCWWMRCNPRDHSAMRRSFRCSLRGRARPPLTLAASPRRNGASIAAPANPTSRLRSKTATPASVEASNTTAISRL